MFLFVRRCMYVFNGSYINRCNELILNQKTNLYMPLDGVNDEHEFIARLLEWCIRDAFKTQPYQYELRNKSYHEAIRNKINTYLKTDFNEQDAELIYQAIGNGINHKLALEFVKNQYDLKMLEKEN